MADEEEFEKSALEGGVPPQSPKRHKLEAESSTTGSTSPTPGYGNGPAYWDKRYSTDSEPFEWLESFTDLEALIRESTGSKLDADILHVGCGNSLLTEAMYDAGYHRIVNIDTSAVAVRLMVKRNFHQRPDMQWFEMDATQLSFSDNSFDVVIDKSVLDTFACGNNAVWIIATYLAEVQRVLRPHGVFLCVSYGLPSTRLDYFQQAHLDFSVQQVLIPAKDHGGTAHYAYVLRKSAVPSNNGIGTVKAETMPAVHQYQDLDS